MRKNGLDDADQSVYRFEDQEGGRGSGPPFPLEIHKNMGLF